MGQNRLRSEASCIWLGTRSLRRNGSSIGLRGSRPENHVGHIPEKLLVGHAGEGLFRELDFGPEMGRKLGEQFNAVHQVEFVSAQQGLENNRGFCGRNALSQASGEMGKLSQRIELTSEKLIEIGFGDARKPHDDGISGDVPEALRFWAEPADQSTDQIKQR